MATYQPCHSSTPLLAEPEPICSTPPMEDHNKGKIGKKETHKGKKDIEYYTLIMRRRRVQRHKQIAFYKFLKYDHYPKS